MELQVCFPIILWSMYLKVWYVKRHWRHTKNLFIISKTNPLFSLQNISKFSPRRKLSTNHKLFSLARWAETGFKIIISFRLLNYPSIKNMLKDQQNKYQRKSNYLTTASIRYEKTTKISHFSFYDYGIINIYFWQWTLNKLFMSIPYSPLKNANWCPFKLTR